mgnify:FL=1
MKIYNDFNPRNISIYLVKNTTRYIYCVLYDKPSIDCMCYLLHFYLLVFLTLIVALPLDVRNHQKVGICPLFCWLCFCYLCL